MSENQHQWYKDKDNIKRIVQGSLLIHTQTPPENSAAIIISPTNNNDNSITTTTPEERKYYYSNRNPITSISTTTSPKSDMREHPEQETKKRKSKDVINPFIDYSPVSRGYPEGKDNAPVIQGFSSPSLRQHVSSGWYEMSGIDVSGENRFNHIENYSGHYKVQKNYDTNDRNYYVEFDAQGFPPKEIQQPQDVSSSKKSIILPNPSKKQLKFHYENMQSMRSKSFHSDKHVSQDIHNTQTNKKFPDNSCEHVVDVEKIGEQIPEEIKFVEDDSYKGKTSSSKVSFVPQKTDIDFVNNSIIYTNFLRKRANNGNPPKGTNIVQSNYKGVKKIRVLKHVHHIISQTETSKETCQKSSPALLEPTNTFHSNPYTSFNMDRNKREMERIDTNYYREEDSYNKKSERRNIENRDVNYEEEIELSNGNNGTKLNNGNEYTLGNSQYNYGYLDVNRMIPSERIQINENQNMDNNRNEHLNTVKSIKQPIGDDESMTNSISKTMFIENRKNDTSKNDDKIGGIGRSSESQSGKEKTKKTNLYKMGMDYIMN